MKARIRIVLAATFAVALPAAALGGCGGRSTSGSVSPRGERAALVSYLRQVEPGDLQAAGRGEIAPSPGGS
jgi:hypothetical protein